MARTKAGDLVWELFLLMQEMEEVCAGVMVAPATGVPYLGPGKFLVPGTLDKMVASTAHKRVAEARLLVTLGVVAATPRAGWVFLPRSNCLPDIRRPGFGCQLRLNRALGLAEGVVHEPPRATGLPAVSPGFLDGVSRIW